MVGRNMAHIFFRTAAIMAVVTSSLRASETPLNERYLALSESRLRNFAYQPRTPLKEEVDALAQWIRESTQSGRSIQIILGDRGSPRFLVEEFRTKVQAPLFIDSALQPQDPYKVLSGSFGIRGTCSDVLNFMAHESRVLEVLQGNVSVVIDDWSLLAGEKNGGEPAPLTRLKPREKFDILYSLLRDSGHIFTSTNFLKENLLIFIDGFFQYKMCVQNIRKNPLLALEAPDIENRDLYKTIPQWILSPRSFVIGIQSATLKQPSAPSLQDALRATDYSKDIEDFFFADGVFGRRFVMFQKSPLENSLSFLETLIQKEKRSQPQ